MHSLSELFYVKVKLTAVHDMSKVRTDVSNVNTKQETEQQCPCKTVRH